MARLNVKERRVEAKIAYVGPPLAGKTTNVDVIRGAPALGESGAVEIDERGGGRVASFAFRPAGAPPFDDCDLGLQILDAHAATAALVLDDVVADADGIVLVLDSARDAVSANRTAYDALRASLARTGRGDAPVVVQLNKRDLAAAMPETELVSALSLGSLPRVAARAREGDGVAETLTTTISAVVHALREKGHVPDGGALEEENPLLDALRRTIAAAVDARLDGAEARLIAAVVAPLEAAIRHADAEAAARVRALRGDVATLAARVNSIEQRVATEVASRAQVVAIATEAKKLETAVTAQVDRLGNDLGAKVRALEPATLRVFAAVNAGSERAEERLVALSAEGAKTSESIHARTDALEKLVNELLAEVRRKKTWFG